MTFSHDEVREALLEAATERARQRFGPNVVLDNEEAIDAARWALTDLLMPRQPRTFNVDPEAFERGVQEIAQRLTRKS